MPSTRDPVLAQALEELVAAMEAFQRAYAEWASAPEDDLARLSKLLAEAEARLDAARAALDRFEAQA